MSNVKSVLKAVKVIEELVYKGEPISITSLSDEISMPISTLHRLLSSLQSVDFVKQNGNDKYAPGLSLKMLTYALLQQEDLRKVALPYLKTLEEKTGETANLVVLSSNLREVIYIEQVESSATVRGFSLIGSRAPSYSTGVGKILLADYEWPKVKLALKDHEMEALTEHTIINLEELKKELKKIANQGFAVDEEETEKGAACIAAPLYNASGEAEAAISISGPSNRVLGDPFSEMTQTTKEVARKLSRELGFEKEN